MSNANGITVSSGNLFADLGLPDAEDLLAKATLALHIRRVIEQRGLDDVQAASLLDFDPGQIDAIVNARLDAFSSDRLMRCLIDLGCDVQIVVSEPHPAQRGRLVFR